MLSDALILVKWPKWVHKHLQEVAKTVFSWEKRKDFLVLILRITILINCTGKFCYRHGIFQNTEVATKGFLKNFAKFTGKHLCQSFSHEDSTFIKKETPTQVLFCEQLFCKRLFLKIRRLMYDSCRPQLSGKKLFWKYLENIQEHICIGLQLLLIYKFHKTEVWLNPHNC